MGKTKTSTKTSRLRTITHTSKKSISNKSKTINTNTNFSFLNVNRNVFSKKSKKVKHLTNSYKKYDNIIEYIDDNRFNLKKGNSIKGNVLDKYFFDSKKNCMCNKTCNSNEIEISNKHTKHTKHTMKLRLETEKYIFIELDSFTHKKLINTYIYKEIPNNTRNINEEELGTCTQFLNNILDGKYDTLLNIINEDIRYKVFINCLLQCVLIIGHLQDSDLEFRHGKYTPDNIFVKECDKHKLKYFNYSILGKNIKIKNMGFAVVIAKLNKSSITLNSYLKNINKKYRIILPILYNPILTYYVNKIIKKYGDIDPNTENIYNQKLVNLMKIIVLKYIGIKVYRDIDLYTFFIKLIDTVKIRNYIINKKINTNIMSFMSNKFQEKLYKIHPKKISHNESVNIAISLLEHTNEKLSIIFTKDYLKMLENLNYYLFNN